MSKYLPKVTPKMAETFQILYEYGNSTPEIAELFGVSHTTVRNWLVKRGVTLRYCGEVPFTPKYDRNLGYVLGVIYGDGTVGKRLTQLVVKDFGFAKAFSVAISKVLGRKKPYAVIPVREKYFGVFFGVKKFQKWIKSLTYEKLRAALLSHEDMSRGFLSGFWDSEGSFSCNYLKADNTDERLIKIVKECLELLGFNVKLLGPYFTTTTWASEVVWRIPIPVAYHERFFSEVGFRRWR